MQYFPSRKKLRVLKLVCTNAIKDAGAVYRAIRKKEHSNIVFPFLSPVSYRANIISPVFAHDCMFFCGEGQ